MIYVSYLPTQCHLRKANSRPQSIETVQKERTSISERVGIRKLEVILLFRVIVYSLFWANFWRIMAKLALKDITKNIIFRLFSHKIFQKYVVLYLSICVQFSVAIQCKNFTSLPSKNTHSISQFSFSFVSLPPEPITHALNPPYSCLSANDSVLFKCSSCMSL
jgi:hypothetical protein